MRAIITVVGQDRLGVIAFVCSWLARRGVNIMNISQTTIDEFLTMTLMVDISGLDITARELGKEMSEAGKEYALSICVQPEEAFIVSQPEKSLLPPDEE